MDVNTQCPRCVANKDAMFAMDFIDKQMMLKNCSDLGVNPVARNSPLSTYRQKHTIYIN